MAAKTMPVGSKIVGVDLEPIRAIPGVVTIVGDITAQKTRQVLPRVCMVSSRRLLAHIALCSARTTLSRT